MLPPDSSDHHLTDSMAVEDHKSIVLNEMPVRGCNRRTTYTAATVMGSSDTVASFDSGLSTDSTHCPIQMDKVRGQSVRDYLTTGTGDGDDEKEKGFPFPLIDCLCDTFTFVRDICFSYLKWFLFVVYNVYWIYGIHQTWHKTESFGDGIKFLTVLTCIWYLFALYYLVLKQYVVKPFFVHVVSRIGIFIENRRLLKKYFKAMIWAVLIACAFVYCLIITSRNRYRLVSGIGLAGFLLFGYLMSEHKRRINWNQVLWGLGMQFSLALLVLRSEFGKQLFNTIGDKITAFLMFTDTGSEFLFGYLVTGNLTGGAPHQMSIFAFKVLPVILFFSFFVSILYYYGIMQTIVEKAGWLLQALIGTTACESLNAAANIFLGMTEAPLLIKPYIPVMTKSELFAVMTGGFATIAGSVLAAYINFGVSASHLLTASVMAAPAALGYSKLFYPETEESRTAAGKMQMIKGTESNALEAAGNGASQAIKICSNIAGNLIAFLAFIKFLDTMCIWLGTNVDLPYVSFEWILSKLFIPIALMMGVEWQDCSVFAKLIGLKTLVNEFVAYAELAKQIKENTISVRTQTIATYALCGFANFSSIGITLGAMGSLVPERKSDLSSLAFKAMICGSTVTFTSACMAGLLIDDSFTSSAFLNQTMT